MKKVYVEITNICNLNCSFCIKNNRQEIFMSTDKFLIILDKLQGHTKYLYFHLLGEPLMHPAINEFIDIASQKYLINITTNGYLIKNIMNNKNIRQLNISLHSFNEIYHKSLESYLNDIFEVTDNLKKYSYINYRIWINSPYKNKIIAILENKYNTKINKHTTLEKNVFIDFDSEFVWPDLNNNYYNEFGTCRALKDHLGILVDGTVVPCCLDSRGTIKLGNIFMEDLDDIQNNDLYQNMLQGFKNNKRCAELCKHCQFKKN